MHRKCALVVALTCTMPALCFAQNMAPGVRMPTTADDKKTMLEQIQNSVIPPTDNLYQAMQEARASSDFYLQAGQTFKRFGSSAKNVRSRFDQSIAALKSQSKVCNDKTELDLKKAVSALGLDVEFVFNFPSDANLSEDFINSRDKILSLSGPAFCAQVKDDATWMGLQRSFQDYLDKSSADASQKAQWASELQLAWDERAHTLGEKLKPSSRISGQLPYIVIILGAFGVGMLGLVKLFSPEIQMELVTSGQIIQFPTVVILLVVLVILGMSDKIADTTLSALLGGLAGYVLSQGVGRASERAAERRAAAQTSPAAQAVRGD